MSEIPEDIDAVASDLVKTRYEDEYAMYIAIARAILAERKRCAEVADSRGSPGHFMNVRRDIRNAINSGEQP